MYKIKSMGVSRKDSLSNHISIATEYLRVLCCPLYYSLYIHIYIYIYMLFIRLHDLGSGCNIGPIFARSFGYSDNISLVSATLYPVDEILKICEMFPDKIGLLFHLLKSKLLCCNANNSHTACVTL